MFDKISIYTFWGNLPFYHTVFSFKQKARFKSVELFVSLTWTGDIPAKLIANQVCDRQIFPLNLYLLSI